MLRSTLIPCGLLLALQQVAAEPEQVAAGPEVCTDTNVLIGTPITKELDNTCLSGCAANDVPTGVFTLTSGDVTASCQESGTISITGDLAYDPKAAERYDVGLWVGPFEDGTCAVYGPSCADRTVGNLDLDLCGDISAPGTIFKGLELEVPCEGSGSLEVNYCFSWSVKEKEVCDEGSDITQGSPSPKCGCNERFTIPEIRVCDAAYTAQASCTADGFTSITITADGVETFEFAVIEKPADGDPEPTPTTTTATSNPFATLETLEQGVEYVVFVEGCGVATPVIVNQCELPCTDDADCVTSNLPRCCIDDKICVAEVDFDPVACGDPHMTGFRGQKFDFTGEDGGWYCLIKDESMQINMRVTSPVPDLPEITYITGLSVLISDDDGSEHDVIIEVKDPHNLDSSCPAGVAPCLADGSLSVTLDGDEVLLAPGTADVGQGIEVSAANLPGACRSFGFEQYWEQKKLEYASANGRRLGRAFSMGEWILADPTATNMKECVEYVVRAEAEDGGLFAHQSEHASFQIVTPKGTVRLSHGRLHQIAMRDPTDQFDLPDHLTWQMNMAVDFSQVSHDAKGVLGETFVPTRDASGKPIMTGMEAIRGTQEDYRVEGALGTAFVQDAHTSLAE